MVLIPIRNVWLLQLFASQLYRRAGSRLSSAEDNPEDLPQLVAEILAEEVSRRIHTGLTVGFLDTTRPVTRVRGRINVLPTERRQLLQRGKVSCTFDEIVSDVPVNRLARAALERATRIIPGEPRYRSLALQLAAAGVLGPCPPLSTVSSMRRQRLLIRDQLMIAAAELLLTLAIPTTEAGTKPLPLPSLEDIYLRKLFEHATWGFYRHRLEPAGWRVSHGQYLNWQTSNASPGIKALLPRMQIDIALEAPTSAEHPSRRIVIDTKFTSITKAGHFGQQTLKSGYVYQIYAYLMSQSDPDQSHRPEGLMLHPSVGEHVDEEVEIQGHRIRFATVDLAAQPHAIAEGFLSAISGRSVTPLYGA
ncbi:5-methylcytosine-specific restriction endonuclease system specificity protein McrC [Agromyces sp. NPDC057865]|uniref:5-methylcytosine restriction system specificity protein McrC n=1 Tax=Agromyces sp. NPDC057865 TaxID=3346267 RepID=UPI0036730849